MADHISTIEHKFNVESTMRKSLGTLTAWYACATLAAWHLSGVLQGNVLESFEVSLALMIIGSSITFFNALVDPNFIGKGLKIIRMKSTQQASIWHYLGTLSMCMAQASFSASLAQIVKSAEPVITIIFSWIIEGIRIDSRRLLGIICISAGVALCSSGDVGLNASGVIYASISACSFPLRNLATYKCGDGLSSTQRFGMVSTVGIIPALCLCIAKWSMMEFRYTIHLPLGRLAIASTSHVGYNIASYAFLEASSPIFHSVANIFKRLVVTLSIFVMARRYPSEPELIGLLILASGIFLTSEKRITLRPLAIYCVPCIFAGSFFMLHPGVRFAHFNTQDPSARNVVGIKIESSAADSRYSPSKLLACIKDVRKKHIEQLNDIFRKTTQFQSKPILLVDPAQHWNIGDTMLVQGQKEFANAFGWGERSLYACGVVQKVKHPSCSELLQRSSRGTFKLALWHAGGNWGDVWLGIQRPRIQSFKYLLGAGLTVVSMPQSMHYDNFTTAHEESRMIAEIAASYSDDFQSSRKKLIFLWRQANSFESAQKLYPFADNRLVPDIAFWCGPYLHHGAPSLQFTEKVDLLLFLRTDKESTLSGAQLHKSPELIRKMLNQSAFTSDHNLSFRLVDWHNVQYLRAINPTEFKPKIEAGVSLINSGRVIVADRLHATILSLLCLKPVFYVDQSYGKIKHTLDAAFDGSDACSDENSLRVFHTSSLAEALERAGQFLDICKRNEDCP